VSSTSSPAAPSTPTPPQETSLATSVSAEDAASLSSSRSSTPIPAPAQPLSDEASVEESELKEDPPEGSAEKAVFEDTSVEPTVTPDRSLVDAQLDQTTDSMKEINISANCKSTPSPSPEPTQPFGCETAKISVVQSNEDSPPAPVSNLSVNAPEFKPPVLTPSSNAAPSLSLSVDAPEFKPPSAVLAPSAQEFKPSISQTSASLSNPNESKLSASAPDFTPKLSIDAPDFVPFSTKSNSEGSSDDVQEESVVESKESEAAVVGIHPGETQLEKDCVDGTSSAISEPSETVDTTSDESEKLNTLESDPPQQTTDNVIDEVNQAVITEVISDSNGNIEDKDIVIKNPPVTIVNVINKELDENKNDPGVEHKMTNGIAHEENDEETLASDVNAEESKSPPLVNGVRLPQLPYRDDQWSPANTEGKKQYDRDFLLQLQKNPLSLQKPEKMPDMEIILPEADLLRTVSSAPNLKQFDMNPQYIKSSSSHRGTPGRRDSRRKESSAAARLNAPLNPKVITLASREEVTLKTAENAWKPGIKKGKAVETDGQDELADLSKKIRSILNKLCPQKFDKLVNQFKELVIDSKEKLSLAMELVFEKALDEPIFSVAYARMCRELELKGVADNEGKAINFRTLLISRCQKEFLADYMEGLDTEEYNKKLENASTEKEKKEITLEFSAKELKLRKRSLGNIRFIGELYKIGMLTGRIMHECVRKLLVKTDEESLECLCNLVTTVGEKLEMETKNMLAKAQAQGTSVPGFSNLDSYFTKMVEITENKSIPARVRFLMQDVIDLRKAKWVKRREDAGPKMIDQVHADAKKEELRVQLANMEPPPARKSEDRSDRRRSQRGPQKERMSSNIGPDGWSSVPEKPANIKSEKIDTSKLTNITKVDVSSMSFGPPGGGSRLGPGGASPFASWGRGASNKKTSVQEPPTVKSVNRFAMFDEDDEGGSGSVSLPPQGSNSYHGRASEPAYRPSSKNDNRDRNNRYGGRSSGGGSGSGRSSREGSAARQFPAPQPSRSQERVPSRNSNRAAIEEGKVEGLLKGDSKLDLDTLENKTKPILDEYLHNQDIGEAFLCVSELYHSATIGNIVEITFNHVLERSSKDRNNAGNLFGYLLKNESLPYSKFLTGTRAILEFAEDLEIDIPKFWHYLAEMLGHLVLEQAAPVKFLYDAIDGINGPLKPKFLAAMLGVMGGKDAKKTQELWQQGGLNITEDFGVICKDSYLADNKLEFLSQPLANGVGNGEAKEESLESKMAALLKNSDQLSQFNDLVASQVPDPKSPIFIRTLVCQVHEACIDTGSGFKLNEERLKSIGIPVLKRYLDAVRSREVEALYSLQALVHRLDHPNKLLHSVFDLLYEYDVISEDAFLEWEVSEDPGEQAGKGVALKSCSQFINWLKTADPEDEEEQTKVNFQIGEEKEVEAP